MVQIMRPTGMTPKENVNKLFVLKIIAGIVVFIVLGGFFLTHFFPLPRQYSSTQWLQHTQGFDASSELPMLSLSKLQGTVGSISGGGSFFFGSGSVNIRGSIQPGSELGFAVDTGSGKVSVLEVPISKINFQIDPSATTPRVKLVLSRSKGVASDYKSLSDSEILQNDLRFATITLTQSLLSQEVSPLIKK